MRKAILIAVPVIATMLIAFVMIIVVPPTTSSTTPTPTPTQPKQTQTQLQYEVRKITINDVPLTVEIADDSEKTARGLMFRDRLADDRGMLFIFEKEHKYQFWMMNMKFNLDMIWLDANGKIVYAVEDAEPCIDETHTSLCTYSPDAPAKYVLEVNSGFVKEHGINKDSIMHILP